jgi:hypothetical protein
MRTTWPKGITNADVDPQGLSVGYWVISASFSYRSSVRLMPVIVEAAHVAARRVLMTLSVQP